MDKGVLLAELRALVDSVPDFDAYSPTSRVHLEWLGKADALLNRWNRYEVISFRVAMGFLTSDTMRPAQVATIVGLLYRAIADLEFEVPRKGHVFGPGAVYDFLKALRDVLGSATRFLFIIDPYLDERVFDTYLSAVAPHVHTRLLISKHAEPLKASLDAFLAQKQMRVEVRSSPRLHDRVVFVDSRSCWVLGQSIKDAARSKPTYLAPLSRDAVAPKLAFYDALWEDGKPL